MFDEEVEERFVKSYPQFCCNGKPLSPFWDLWEAGVEFAYNKANEWHYPSKGKYPEENLECLCIDKVWTGQTFTTILKCCDGVFIDSNGTPYDVIAWKDIVLPELKENG